jgi:glycosyltransferase involved in cell wall biosynthesis
MQERHKPQISVIMTVFNAEPHLQDAVRSVQQQTITDWELIAIDDASTDKSLTILKELADKDKRIRILQLDENRGAGAARDAAIQEARAPFIAIADADDICAPDRFVKQLAFLSSRPDVVAAGSQTTLIDAKGKQAGTKTFPTDSNHLHDLMYTAIPIQLPTLMVNRAKLPPDFSWFEGWRYSEDTLLFFKLAQSGAIANLPDFLVQYRFHPDSTSFRHAKKYFYETYKARQIARKQLGYRPTCRARIVSGLQYLVVSCLPARFVPTVYQSVRNLMLALSGKKVTP